MPGWGQFGNAQPNKGAVFIGGAIVGLLLASKTLSIAGEGNAAKIERTLGWMILGINAAVGAYDAYAVADRLNRENGYDISRVPDVGAKLALLRWEF